ncbi:MAG: hypothetical protein JKY42_08785 [Flavobacteriales bacterium]|nr:hypothetical protein [Flavobacteriales bacterium]
MVYYLNASVISKIGTRNFGIRIVARPNSGFSYYTAAEFRSKGMPIENIITPNQVTYLEIIMKRNVDENVFRFGPGKDNDESFKKIKPSGRTA